MTDLQEAQAAQLPGALPLIEVAPFPKERFLKWIGELKVQTKDFGLQPFRLLGTQRYILQEIIDGLEKGISTFVILKARQIGASTVFIALDLFWAFEFAGLSGAFATHTDQSKAQFRNIIKTFFAHLPKTHKVKFTTENRDMIVLKNGSMLVYLVAGIKQKEVASMGRSGAYNYLHATEVAFWGNEDDKKELGATLSTHYLHRLEVYESTANGFNHFHEQWLNAKSSPTQKAIFVGWWRNELYAFGKTHPWYRVYMPDGEASVLSALERRRLGEVKQLYDYEITSEQMAWYRWRLAEKTDGDQAKMDEMFPFTEEDAFVATGAKFFTNDSLTLAMRSAKKKPILPYRYLIKDSFESMQVVNANPRFAQLKLWEEAEPGGVYAIGCDPAYGSSDEADSSVVNVLRCFSDRAYQVAEFSTPIVSTFQCAWVLAHLAGYYKGALVNLEITGPGSAVFDELNRLKRENAVAPKQGQSDLRNVLANMTYYLYSRVDSLGGSLAYQWRTTSETKSVAMNSFRDSFELGRVIINSMMCLEEMKSVVMEDGVIHAEGRGKDDRVMAAALAHEAWRRWLQPKLFAQGMTLERSLKEQEAGPQTQVQKMAIDYLHRMRVLATGQNIGEKR